MTKATFSLVVIENHSIVAAGIRSLIEDSQTFVVLGIFDNGLDGLKAIRQKKPDIAIVDLSLPKMNGVDVIRELFLENHPCKIVVLSRNDYTTQVAELLRYNIAGYVLKDDAYEELVPAMCDALRGKCFISPKIRTMLVRTGQLSSDGEKNDNVLTKREKQIVRMYWEGSNTTQVSNALFISEATVRVHKKNIMSKLGLNSFTDLAALKGKFF